MSPVSWCHTHTHTPFLDQRPEYSFTCQSPVLSVRFHDFMPNCLIGGTYSGRVVLWDMRAKSAPVQTTPLTTDGHAHPVYSLALVGSTAANTLYSLSTDGRLCAWNTSSLSSPLVRLRVFRLPVPRPLTDVDVDVVVL